jgi:hypothetical protein
MTRMGWTMVINPRSKKFKEIWPSIEEAYTQEKKNFEKKADKI